MINEKLLKTLVNETINILLENRESKNINLARKELKNHGYEGEENKNTLDLIRNKVPNVRLGEYKFFLGVVRLWLNNELISETDEKLLNKLLLYIASEAHINEYDYNLNNLSLNDLKEKFETIIINDIEKQKKESDSKTYTKNKNYEIIRIPDFETAAQYQDYTDWCVTIDEGRFDDYTDGGSGAFYFCLRKGFENEKEVVGENCPLDNYGLSMIAVSVTEDGAPNTITCRWNHANKGNDHIMSVEELEELLGVNFFQTFLPYTKLAIKMLKQGIPLEEIFNEVGNFKNGFAKVKLNNKWSFINSNSDLIGNGKLWFDYVFDFEKGFAKVRLNEKYSFINSNGELIGNGKLWFDGATEFNKNGFAEVELNDKQSFINSNGELIGKGKLWFDNIDYFRDGFAKVELDDQYSFINSNGNLIGNGKLWFDTADVFRDGFAKVELNDKQSFINSNGELIGKGKLWFDYVDYFYHGFVKVELNDKQSFINSNGDLIGNGKLWFDYVGYFEDGFALVRIKKRYSFINSNGELIGNGKLWFDNAYDFENNFAEVNFKGQHYCIDTNGNFYTRKEKEPIPLPINENKLNKTIITEDILMKLVKETINNLLKK